MIAPVLFLALYAEPIALLRWDVAGAPEKIVAAAREAFDRELLAAGFTLVSRCERPCPSLEAAVVFLAGKNGLSVRVSDVSGREVTTSFDEVDDVSAGLPSLREAIVMVAPLERSRPLSGTTFASFGSAVALGAFAGVAALISSNKVDQFESHLLPNGDVSGLSLQQASDLESSAVTWAWTRNAAIGAASLAAVIGVWSLIDDLSGGP